MDSAIEKDGTQLQKNNFGTFQALSFVGKYEQLSTYVSWKIPFYQSYKRQKEKYSSNETFDC